MRHKRGQVICPRSQVKGLEPKPELPGPELGTTALHTLNYDRLSSYLFCPSVNSAKTDSLSGWFNILSQVPTTVFGP